MDEHGRRCKGISKEGGKEWKEQGRKWEGKGLRRKENAGK